MKKRYQLFALLTVLVMTACEKYLDNTPLPANQIEAGGVYSSDNTTSGVVTGLYMSLNSSGAFAGGAASNLSYTLALYADETKSLGSASFSDVFYKNAIQVPQSGYWETFYKKIFNTNTAIEGILSNGKDLKYKDQWLGECYFLRAFYYYHLVNIYGPVPLALSSDFETNRRLFRKPVAEVYAQIIADLKQAQLLLTDDYKDAFGKSTSNRYRANKAVATALLARMYLYQQDWANAETEATKLIENASYGIIPLDQVFLANSKETIWALANNEPKRTNEFNFYNGGMPDNLAFNQSPNTPFNVASQMSSPLLDAFETGDARLTSWVRTVTAAASATRPVTVYKFPAKYKSSTNNAELQVLFRLAEQYLIRAEARAMQNKSTATDDLNVIRRRANLQDINPAGQSEMLVAIARERQTELFTESGHRFYDLKRSGRLDPVMTAVAATKLSVWQSYMANWPIPTNDILQNSNIEPNPGYLQ